MNRICKKCGIDISEGRLKALPETQTCVDCSKTNRKKGFKVITGKVLDKYDKKYRQNKV